MKLVTIFHTILILFTIKNVETKSDSSNLISSAAAAQEEIGNGESDDRNCDCDGTGTKRIQDLILPENYNKLEIPIPKAVSESPLTDRTETLRIGVGVLIRKIREIDEIEEEITVEMDFIATWTDWLIFEANRHVFYELNLTDENLERSFKTLDASILGHIWKPDLFIEHVLFIARPQLISKPIKINFSPIGTIIYSTRITLKMDCDMEFHFYPADTQYCIFNIRSYSHTVKEMRIDWMAPLSAFVFDRSDTNFDVMISEVTIQNKTEFHGLHYEEYSETYNILQFTMSVRRRLSFHFIQTYLPSIFFIGITWLCFLVPAKQVEVRIGVAMTTLLTLTSMFSSIRENTPAVSYIKAIDIWMVVCIFFVFATLVEFALLVWLDYELEIAASLNGNPQTIYSKVPPMDEDEETFRKRLRASRADWRMSDRKYRNAAIFIHMYGFRLLFISFLLFNLGYWPWLLLKSNYFQWDVDPKYNVRDE